ncbi:MAG: PDZ domain-containing protein, partial [Gammaproteobacteria bacterium]
VSLVDGRSFAARVLGSDEELDIAVLKIEADELVDVKIGDSNSLAVGDFVVAIGNPFGLGQTVTTGIVSALGRTGLGIEGYENFIQTDASINPGNSGGALVNLAGELIGINTAIIAPSGGNVGIGFAIPVSMAKASLAQILEHGEVRRGQVGIGIQDITPDLRKAFNLKNGQQGVLVTNVVAKSPAEKAGINAGDVVIAVDGQTVESTGKLRSVIGTKSIGERVRLTLLREGDRKHVNVKVGESQALEDANREIHALLKGVQFDDDPTGKGIVVTSIAPNSNAAYSGLQAGDIIVAVNKRRVFDVASLRKALSRRTTSILLQVNRRGGSLFIVIR